MEIIDVEFDENSKIHLEPIYKYKRCWRSLWILKCAYPNYGVKIFGRSAWNSNTPESIIEALKFVEKH